MRHRFHVQSHTIIGGSHSILTAFLLDDSTIFKLHLQGIFVCFPLAKDRIFTQSDFLLVNLLQDHIRSLVHIGKNAQYDLRILA